MGKFEKKPRSGTGTGSRKGGSGGTQQADAGLSLSASQDGPGAATLGGNAATSTAVTGVSSPGVRGPGGFGGGIGGATQSPLGNLMGEPATIPTSEAMLGKRTARSNSAGSARRAESLTVQRTESPGPFPILAPPAADAEDDTVAGVLAYFHQQVDRGDDEMDDDDAAAAAAAAQLRRFAEQRARIDWEKKNRQGLTLAQLKFIPARSPPLPPVTSQVIPHERLVRSSFQVGWKRGGRTGQCKALLPVSPPSCT